MRWGVEQREGGRGGLLWTRFEKLLSYLPPEAVILYGRLLLSHASGKDVLGLPGAANSVLPNHTLLAMSPANVGPQAWHTPSSTQIRSLHEGTPWGSSLFDFEELTKY